MLEFKSLVAALNTDLHWIKFAFDDTHIHFRHDP